MELISRSERCFFKNGIYIRSQNKSSENGIIRKDLIFRGFLDHIGDIILIIFYVIDRKGAITLDCFFGHRLNAANAFAVFLISVAKLFDNWIFVVHDNVVAVKNGKRIVTRKLSRVHQRAAGAVHRLLTDINDIRHV